MRPATRTEKIIEIAEDQWEQQGLEFDDQAKISDSSHNGAWVSTWVWVDFSETELNKENGNGG